MPDTSLQLPHEQRLSAWFTDFLRRELAPYPGRGAAVARMVISATITALLIQVFRIPGGVNGALCAFILSREDISATTKSATSMIVAFLIGGLFIPIGARMFASVPLTHFLWEGISLFLVFFLLKTLTNYPVATGLGLSTTTVLSIWYLPGPAQRNVELTLWQIAAVLLGAFVTLGVEVIFHAFNPGNPIVKGLDIRLEQIELQMKSYAAGEPLTAENRRMLGQYAVVGMGALRREIMRANLEPLQRMRMSALVSLTGRSMDFAAALATQAPALGPDGQQRAAKLQQHIAEIRENIWSGSVVQSWTARPEEGRVNPLLSEIDAMLSLIPTALASETIIDPRLAILETPTTESGIFVQDAFTNPEHIRYALSGTLAAMLCYILYIGLDWPGIATSVTTCVLTALTNIGTSRQKQLLRVSGAILGGFVFGMGAQIFILPNLDTIAGFLLLFASVTAIAAWVSTSSTRLSYAGMQIALAFYLINLGEFHVQVSLGVARDRAVGVVLGTFMMWLVFERLYATPAAYEMVRIFVRNLRVLADMTASTAEKSDTEAIIAIRRQRDEVYRNFGAVNAQADAVPFETGPERAADMAARDRIRRWQAELRTFYLLQTPLIQLRIFGEEGPQNGPVVRLDNILRHACARSFRQIADCLESQLNKVSCAELPDQGLTRLMYGAEQSEVQPLTPRDTSLFRLTGSIAELIDRLHKEVAAEPLYATNGDETES